MDNKRNEKPYHKRDAMFQKRILKPTDENNIANKTIRNKVTQMKKTENSKQISRLLGKILVARKYM